MIVPEISEWLATEEELGRGPKLLRRDWLAILLQLMDAIEDIAFDTLSDSGVVA